MIAENFCGFLTFSVFKKLTDLLRKFLPENKTQKRKFGDEGEYAAAEFLKKRGLKILVRNFKNDHDEIDIVALDKNDTLVFVEVKTRNPAAQVAGYYAAQSKRKRTAVRRGANAYICQLRTRPRYIRFDIIDVELDLNSGKEKFKIEHFENVGY